MNDNETIYELLKDRYLVKDGDANRYDRMGEWLNDFPYHYARHGFTDGWEQAERFFKECQAACTWQNSSDDWITQEWDYWLDQASRRDIITRALARGHRVYTQDKPTQSTTTTLVDRKSWDTIDHSVFDTSREFKWVPHGIICVSNYELCVAPSGTGKSVFHMYQAAVWGKGLAIIGTETDKHLAVAYMKAYGLDFPIRQYDPMQLFELIGPNLIDHYDFILSTWEGETGSSHLPMLVIEDQYEYVNEYVSRGKRDYYTTEPAQAMAWEQTALFVKQHEFPLIADSKPGSNGANVKGNQKPWEKARVRRRLFRDGNTATIKVEGSAIGTEYHAELVTDWFSNNGIRTPFVEGILVTTKTPDADFLRSLMGQTYKGDELATVYRYHVNPARKWGQSAPAISRAIDDFKNFATVNGFDVQEYTGQYNAKTYTVVESEKLTTYSAPGGYVMKRKSGKLTSTTDLQRETLREENISTSIQSSTFSFHSLPPSTSGTPYDSPHIGDGAATQQPNFYEHDGELVYGPREETV